MIPEFDEVWIVEYPINSLNEPKDVCPDDGVELPPELRVVVKSVDSDFDDWCKDPDLVCFVLFLKSEF